MALEVIDRRPDGSDEPHAKAAPKRTPTRRAPTSPGPAVTATNSTGRATDSSALSTRSGSALRCSREASSGTTPPNGAWAAIWLDSRLASTRPSPSSTATAVSSHEVSIPRVRNICLKSPILFNRPRALRSHSDSEFRIPNSEFRIPPKHIPRTTTAGGPPVLPPLPVEMEGAQLIFARTGTSTFGKSGSVVASVRTASRGPGLASFLTVTVTW